MLTLLHRELREQVSDGRFCTVAYAYMDMVVWRFHRGETPVADLAMLKVAATTTLEHCARESLGSTLPPSWHRRLTPAIWQPRLL